MMKNKLKLFVWTNFSFDWHGGLAFAIAETTEEAKEMIIEKLDYDACDWGDLNVLSLENKVAFCVAGGS